MVLCPTVLFCFVFLVSCVLSARMGEVMLWKQTIHNINGFKQQSLLYSPVPCSVEAGGGLSSVVTQGPRLMEAPT